MSRGPGKLQRAILDFFENPPPGQDDMPDSITLAGILHNVNPVPESAVVSTRRALRGLAERGLIVDMGRGWRYGRRRWATPERAAKYLKRVERTFGKRTR